MLNNSLCQVFLYVLFLTSTFNCLIAGSQRSLTTGRCKPKHFECMPEECIPSPWVCDGEEVHNIPY